MSEPKSQFPTSASFAWSAGRGGPGLETRLFRLAFELSVVPPSILLHVSADSRYRLFLDGVMLGRGPVKGTLRHYHFETYDLAPRLVPGRHLLAAEVRWFGDNAPASEVHGPWGGLLIACPAVPALTTPGGWRVFPLEAVTPDTIHLAGNAQSFLNHMESVDLRRWPREWNQVAFDDHGWESAVAIGRPVGSGHAWGVEDLHHLQPTDIPPLTEEPCGFSAHRFAVGEAFTPGAGTPWQLAPGRAGTVTLDAGVLTTGFVELASSGGAGRTIRVTYSEALGHWSKQDSIRTWEKHRRDDPTGVPHGHTDTLILAGDDSWEPFHWRAFRFVLIEVLAGDTPFALTRVAYRRSTYPHVRRADFASSDPQGGDLWDVSWQTFQASAHETYDDSPFFEQFSYTLDTRLECLQSYYFSNETRLPRRALRQFLQTLRSDGLIDSRVPSHHVQTIPYFCLHWILMVLEYWEWVGPSDRAFIRDCLVAVDTILVWFRARLREDDFVGPLPPWNMVDRAPGWRRGEPPAAIEGGSTYLTALFAQAAHAAVRLHTEAGHPPDAARWRPLVNRLRRAVRTRAWNDAEGLFDEGPGRADHRSQHAQFVAINSGSATRRQARSAVRRLFDPAAVHPANFSQSYDLVRGLETAGAYEAFHRHVLTPWRAMLADGATTWWEYPNPTRSDCHGWSAWIAVDFLRTVLGARPGAPGWSRITLAPQFAGLTWARGSLETPAGPVSVEWQSDPDGIRYRARTPPCPVEVRLPNGTSQTFPEGGRIDLLLPPQARPSPITIP